MWFLSPLFWLGIAAVAAPILVHLVRRTRARKVEFPALTFVRQVPQRTIRRRTLRNLLLLILRCLAILLIVIAFTRPFFSRRSAAKDSAPARPKTAYQPAPRWSWLILRSACVANRCLPRRCKGPERSSMKLAAMNAWL